jgi:hypothetical protein
VSNGWETDEETTKWDAKGSEDRLDSVLQVQIQGLFSRISAQLYCAAVIAMMLHDKGTWPNKLTWAISSQAFFNITIYYTLDLRQLATTSVVLNCADAQAEYYDVFFQTESTAGELEPAAATIFDELAILAGRWFDLQRVCILVGLDVFIEHIASTHLPPDLLVSNHE